MNFLHQQYSTRRFQEEEKGDGNSGGGSGSSGFSQADMDTAISKAVGDATSGLKEKNTALLDENKTFKAGVKQWEGMNFEEVTNIMGLFKNNEEAQLIKDGKFEEVITKRMDKAVTEHTTQITASTDALAAMTTERDTFKSKFENKFVDDAVQGVAIKTKALPEALGDITARAREIFRVDDKGELEARDAEGNLLKTESGDLLTPERFVETLRKSNPYYWPASESAGHGGGAAPDAEDLGRQLQAAADSGDMELYRKLRVKLK